MSKVLKSFKRKNINNSLKAEVLDAEEPSENMPQIIANDTTVLGVQTLRLLDQLEKAGFTAIAERLRHLQIVSGLDELEPYLNRIAMVEDRIDELLTDGKTIEDIETSFSVGELAQVLSVAVDAYQARVKALLMPYGFVHPRTVLQSTKMATGSVQVAIGIGTGVSPRSK